MKLPKKLQTSPFIALVPNSPNNKLHSIMTGDFYDIDSSVIKVLEHCKLPRDTEHLIQMFGSETIEESIGGGFLLDPQMIWDTTNIEYLEIETNTHCNWRCGYCPVHFNPKAKSFMNMDLFSEIIDKALRHPSLKYVTLNFYNEPTLDKYFEDRIKKLSGTRLKLILSTNGSELDTDKIRTLSESGVLSTIRFNLPSIEQKEFTRLTGSMQYGQIMRNVENAVHWGLNVQMIVNGTSREIRDNLKGIEERFQGASTVRIEQNITHDRAGLVKDRYAMNIRIGGLLYGCSQVTNWLHVGVNGDIFICSMDYYKNEVYGNIRDGEIADILKSEKARLLRKRIYGAENAPEDYICRKCIDMKAIKMLYYYSKSFRPVFEV